MDKVIISKGYNSLTGECSSELDTPPVSQIIDGVDVSECKYNEKESCYIYACSCDADDFCTGNKNCYYKQLQRAKAELKKYEDMAKKGLEEFKDVGGCWGCGIQESLNQAWADCKTYRQALQEIRDIAKEQLQNVSDRCINTTPMYIVHKHIIDKINEVIEGK